MPAFELLEIFPADNSNGVGAAQAQRFKHRVKARCLSARLSHQTEGLREDYVDVEPSDGGIYVALISHNKRAGNVGSQYDERFFKSRFKSVEVIDVFCMFSIGLHYYQIYISFAEHAIAMMFIFL